MLIGYAKGEAAWVNMLDAMRRDTCMLTTESQHQVGSRAAGYAVHQAMSITQAHMCSADSQQGAALDNRNTE
jgi:hypothetical protein